MAQYNEKYSLNQSAQQTTRSNELTVVPDLNLAANNLIELTLNVQVYEPGVPIPTSLADVNIVVYDSNYVAVAQTSSYAPGTTAYTLVFQGSLNEKYIVIASKNGYYTGYNEVEYTTQTIVGIVFILSPDTLNSNVIYGVVTDSKGTPLVNANVTIYNGAIDIVTVSTDRNGSFMAYDNFQENVNYTVTARLVGYIENSVQVNIQIGTNSAYVTISLQSNGESLTSIVGRVVIEGTNVPIKNALVGLFTVSAGGDNFLIRTAFTDEYGYYGFTNVLSGTSYIIKSTKIEESV